MVFADYVHASAIILPQMFKQVRVHILENKMDNLCVKGCIDLSLRAEKAYTRHTCDRPNWRPYRGLDIYCDRAYKV